MYALSVVLLRHLEPALAMLKETVLACPEATWQRQASPGPAEHVYHAISSVDFWIRDLAEPFQPPAFHDEHAAMMSGPAERGLDKDTLLAYLEEVRANCRDRLNIDDQELLATLEVRGTPLSLADRCLMQIRHVQHHVGVLHRMTHEETPADLPWREHAKSSGPYAS